jgi:hypothetical protein
MQLHSLCQQPKREASLKQITQGYRAGSSNAIINISLADKSPDSAPN